MKIELQSSWTNAAARGAVRTHEVTLGSGQPREADDDFFCLRYAVWYPSFDCAWRTRDRTAPGCADCEQGRFNLKRHAATLAQSRHPLRCVSRE